MDYICGVADFHKLPQYNGILKLASENSFSAYADERVMLCRMFDCRETKSQLFTDEKTASVSIGEPFSNNCCCGVFDKTENLFKFYTTGEHQLLYVFSGTELFFANEPSILQSILYTKKGIWDSITSLENGKIGTFSKKGFYIY